MGVAEDLEEMGEVGFPKGNGAGIVALLAEVLCCGDVQIDRAVVVVGWAGFAECDELGYQGIPGGGRTRRWGIERAQGPYECFLGCAASCG
ncbi:hypothetical protein GCM10009665_50870 [Kitasatospora nipponensis]|uniref:Pyridoxal-phosphate dependent enzyme n=1 Tax=Kitasatospora nipponensis TaxID=258049 RepID=A0ABP4HA38_9ACTN